MLLIIDNYDSFTYNLVQYFGELGAEMEIYRNDAVSIAELKKRNPSKICISPGPCSPNEAGISNAVIKEFISHVPILGVCLGHQCLAHVFGGDVVRADRLMHGKTSSIYHDGEGVFKKIATPFIATRYHSLIVKKATLPDCFKITAWTKEEEIMGIQHKEYPAYGVQFHPESILTKEGKTLIQNFLSL